MSKGVSKEARSFGFGGGLLGGKEGKETCRVKAGNRTSQGQGSHVMLFKEICTFIVIFLSSVILSLRVQESP